MKKILLVFISAAVYFMPLSAEAFSLSGLKKAASVLTGINTSSRAGSTDTQTQLAGLNANLQEIDASVQNSFLSAVSMLSSKQEASVIENKASLIMSDTKISDTEKSLLISQLMQNYASSLYNNKTSAASSLKDAEKTALSNILSSLTQSGKDYAALSKKYAALAQAASSVLELKETASAVKQAVTSIKSRSSAAASLASAVMTLMKE